MAQYAVIEGEDSESAAYAEALAEEYEMTHLPGDEIPDHEWRDTVQRCTSILVLGEVAEEVDDYLSSVSGAAVLSDQEESDFLTVDYDDLVLGGLYETVQDGPHRERAERLGDVIADHDSWAVGIHNTPDPDAISSAVAFAHLADHYNVEADIYYAGDINHQENTALVNVLDLDLNGQPLDTPIDTGDYEGIAMLDTASISYIDVFEDAADVDVVIDHHSTWDETADQDAEFFDVQSDRSATAGIMADYLRGLALEPGETVATALVHGIYADTGRLSPGPRGLADPEADAFAWLYPSVDKSSLGDILESQLSASTLKTIGAAATGYTEHGATVISYLDDVDDINAVDQSADFLKKLDSANTAIAAGVIDNQYIKVSARSTEAKINVGDTIKDVFADDIDALDADDDQWGAGGHPHMGGASLPLSLFSASTDLYEDGDETDREQFHQLVERWLHMKLGDFGRDA